MDSRDIFFDAKVELFLVEELESRFEMSAVPYEGVWYPEGTIPWE